VRELLGGTARHVARLHTSSGRGEPRNLTGDALAFDVRLDERARGGVELLRDSSAMRFEVSDEGVEVRSLVRLDRLRGVTECSSGTLEPLAPRLGGAGSGFAELRFEFGPFRCADAAAFGFDHRRARRLRRSCRGARVVLDVRDSLLRALLLGEEAF
jgi:hypothetical protein